MTIKKEYYTVKIEATAPITITYKVLAESAEDAIRLIATQSPSEVSRPQLAKARRIDAKVYKAGTTLLKYSKKF